MSIDEPRWVSRAVIDAAHHDLIKTFGGLEGIRDEGALESALARAQQKFSHDDGATFADLCACYGFGIARSHPYNDGNKRSAFAAMMIFARFNKLTIKANEESVVFIMLGVASSQASEEDLASWLKDHLVPYMPRN